ncbi:MAG TPA: thioredoxin family protein [Flavobacterium sp.]|nr:thioredoxin family protein [Flavobacterium sp.]
MKKAVIILFTIVVSLQTISVNAQTTLNTEKRALEKPYHPEDHAQEKIDTLIKQAKKNKKHVILQAGGNWCSWCLLFNDFIKTNQAVKSNLNKNFLYYHLNFSKENKNEEVFKKYAPEGDKLGYPFFIILDSNGEVIKIQESGSLEEGKGYSETKVLLFLNSVKPKK